MEVSVSSVVHSQTRDEQDLSHSTWYRKHLSVVESGHGFFPFSEAMILTLHRKPEIFSRKISPLTWFSAPPPPLAGDFENIQHSTSNFQCVAVESWLGLVR